MATPSKNLMDMLGPKAKRLKKESSILSNTNTTCISATPSSGLTAEQKSRSFFNQLKAISKRNLRACLDTTLSNSFSSSSSPGESVPSKLKQLLVEKTWLDALPGEFEKPYAKDLCTFVESEMRNSSDGSVNVCVPVYPPPHLIFYALNSTPFDRVKVVIIGQDPYHGPGQAMGLSFSVPVGIKVPPSLINIYKELQQDLGCSIPNHGNLEGWAFQGVLLLNAVLTVRQHQANSHARKGWEQFTDAVIEAISKKREGIIFLLWGNYAQAKCRLIDGTKHHVLKAAHPSGLSASRGFFGCRHFSCANKLLVKMGMSPIDWQL